MKLPSLSAEKLRATRQSAGKSQGPRTVAGKARSSQNDFRKLEKSRPNLLEVNIAGLTLGELQEDPQAFDSIRHKLENSFHPATPAEALLVEDMALLR